MVQKLNHSELKDITDIVYYTNLKQKNLVLRNTLVLGYTIADTLLCWVVCACVGLACRSIYKDKKSGKSSCGGSCGHCGSHSMCENPKAFFDQIKKEQFSK